jgi:hypothetical protein
VVVQDFEVRAPVPRALLQSHGKDHLPAGAQQNDLELLTDFYRRYRRHHVGDATDRRSIHGQKNIPLPDATIGSGRARNDGLDQNAGRVPSCSRARISSERSANRTPK